MMLQPGLHKILNTGLWPKCTENATKLNIIMVNPHGEKFTHEKFYGKLPHYTKYLRTFGEMGVVRSIDTVKVKLED